jgi:hypothetical protein
MATGPIPESGNQTAGDSSLDIVKEITLERPVDLYRISLPVLVAALAAPWMQSHILSLPCVVETLKSPH